MRSRLRRLVLVCVVLGVLVGGLVPGVALAGSVYPSAGFFGGPLTFINPQSITVDEASGDVYVVDVGAGTVSRYDAGGAPVVFSAVGSNVIDGASGADATPHGAFRFDSPSAAQVAVDDSGGATNGYIYVASESGAVDVFDGAGAFVGEIDGSAASPQQGGELCGVAVDPSGDVYGAYLQGHSASHVDKYTLTDADPAHDTFAGQLEGLDQSCNVAADGSGNIYVSTWNTGPLTRYASSQLDLESPVGSVVDAVSLAVAVDPVSNDVFVDEGSRIAQFNPAGEEVGQSGLGVLSGSSYGVAVRGSTGDLYASDATSQQVDRFGPPIAVPAPVVTIAAATGVTTSGATLHGSVNPNGSEPANDTSWHFEYSTDGGSSWASTTEVDAGTGTTPVAVEAQITGLLAHQTVAVRLRAGNAGGHTTSSVEPFDTPTLAPDVLTEPAQDITPDHAALTATLDAHNAPTTYFFEYGTTAAYGSSIPAAQDSDGGTSPRMITVQQDIYGLRPGSTYHYRIVAHDQAGTATGSDQTFTTTTPPAASVARQGIPGTGFLPDDRGWELVSPVDKNGAGVMIDTAHTRAAASETPGEAMAATFGSLGAFADTHGTAVASEYMAVRSGRVGTSGWDTHGITPPQQPKTFFADFKAMESLLMGDPSPDLSRGVYASWTPLTDAPSVKDVMNLYRREDLRTPGAGVYDLLSDCALCSATGTPLSPIGDTGEIPEFAGASADFSHIIFESDQPLVAGAAAGVSNLYEWANGTLRLAGILPDSACGSPPCVAPASIAGKDGGTGPGSGSTFSHSPHTISTDGSRIIFTDISAGNGAFTGNLYMRIDGSSTVQINASEKNAPDSSAPANYQTASTDGSRVFFTTSEQLTDTPSGGGIALYMYDLNALAGQRLTLISVDHEPADPPNSVLGVMGASDDGHYVYFISAGQLVAGQPPLRADMGIYEWHDGAISYVGRLADKDQTNDETQDVLPNFYGLLPPTARVTPDGRHLLFQSSADAEAQGSDLTGYDSNKHVELYLYSADSHELQCASCRPDGSPAGGDALVTVKTLTGGAVVSWHLSRAVTDDGSRVFFSTTDSLVPQDVNGKSDAYEFDSVSGTVHLLSSGTDNADSYFMDASASGDDVFFVTRQSLVGWDKDASYDLYDARVGGGLPETVVGRVCSGGECQPAPVGAGGVVSPGSAVVSGGGNLAPVVSSRVVKGKAKKKAKHKKPKPRKRKAGKRRARRAVRGGVVSGGRRVGGSR